MLSSSYGDTQAPCLRFTDCKDCCWLADTLFFPTALFLRFFRPALVLFWKTAKNKGLFLGISIAFLPQKASTTWVNRASTTWVNRASTPWVNKASTTRVNWAFTPWVNRAFTHQVRRFSTHRVNRSFIFRCCFQKNPDTFQKSRCKQNPSSCLRNENTCPPDSKPSCWRYRASSIYRSAKAERS